MRDDFIMFIAVGVGLAVAAALSLWRWRGLKGKSLARGAFELGLTLAIAAGAGVLTHRIILSGHEAKHNVEPALQALKQTPMLRLVLADVPGAEELMRSAMHEDVRWPVTSGQTRAYRPRRPPAQRASSCRRCSPLATRKRWPASPPASP